MREFLALFLFSTSAWAQQNYPRSWWPEVAESERSSWEILPQDAAEGEVILSKRTELGVFSNLSKSPFDFEGHRYASVEGLWQMMKYPENQEDPRARLQNWAYSREQVALLHGWEAKDAGDSANVQMRNLGISWISYQGQQFNYKDGAEGSAFHYDLIYRATREKINQNPSLARLLIQTEGLLLRSDHHQNPTDPPAYRTPEILMRIRTELQHRPNFRNEKY